MTVTCQELLLATHPLNVCPLQPGSRKDMLTSFLFERCILFDILKNILNAFCCYWGIFLKWGLFEIL